MTPADMSATMARLGLRTSQVARLCGVDPRTVRTWLAETRAIPRSAGIILHQYEQLQRLRAQDGEPCSSCGEGTDKHITLCTRNARMVQMPGANAAAPNPVDLGSVGER